MVNLSRSVMLAGKWLEEESILAQNVRFTSASTAHVNFQMSKYYKERVPYVWRKIRVTIFIS